jgi:hypothetical protein
MRRRKKETEAVATRSAGEHLRDAIESVRHAQSQVEDKKLRGEIGKALAVLAKATKALADGAVEGEAENSNGGGAFGRKLLLLGLGGGLALAGSAPLRTKVLDMLFGAEEEFQYSPPPTAVEDAPPAPAG